MAKINEREIGENARRSLVIEVDGREIVRGLFGRLRWRYWVAAPCLWLAKLVLGCKLEVKTDVQ